MHKSSQPIAPPSIPAASKPLRIAVIGSGGAGMTAAWLLDERHQVTLFERSPILGGHAHTTRVELAGRTHFVDDGFSWFSDVMYPNFMRLLELTGVPTRSVPMTLSFRQSRLGDRTLTVPPHGMGRLLRSIAHPPTLDTLVRLARAIAAGRRVVERNERLVSWAEFVHRHRFPEAFCRDILTPLVAGCWGGPVERIPDFSAYTLMKYLVFHSSSGLKPYKWHVIRDGAASYIGRVAGQLTRTRILAGTSVVGLERRADSWQARDDAGGQHDFDHVILAVGSRDAQRLLREVTGLDATRKVMDRFEHYAVRLATHSDPSFMPPRRQDWQVANVAADGLHARLTTWTDAAGGGHVFASYLGDREPRHCHHISTFNLPLFTTEHYRAQEALAARQGQDGLWFTGDWTRDIGAHEDAITSAIDAVRKLDPGLIRLARLAMPRRFSPMTPLPDTPPELHP